MTPLLEFDHVTLGYSSSPVVRDLSLAVEAGEVVALLGPNGAGKTTTLRAASGLLTPMAGTIRFDGADLAGRNPVQVARAGLVQMTDARSVFRGLTVEEHFRLRHRRQTLDRDLAYDYFPALRKLAKRRAGLLSGGEQQMLGLGRALARRPRVLMVDELSLGLAPVIVQRLLPILRRFADDADAGVLLIEQHVQMALSIADRGSVLVHGDLVVEGPAEQLLRDRHLLTASYLGSNENLDHEQAQST
ncbi:ABC transporter ATP-binding protein [Cryptosporangium aurantiacum]|uniref:Branched-chain amino acid transport system ATP-binding protein n=1 Tax=Cryptosporangium aurantiacum TaxID=134849 RepID=A0A1M7R340_9ACTN|nr:ABC transporter ATP-binding protein [Cryptosporangium aurantiacum]SHN39391.1 branched-chain amino acid transport system ATP-binding protein [Cryptosporangium aurantiacum]